MCHFHFRNVEFPPKNPQHSVKYYNFIAPCFPYSFAENKLLSFYSMIYPM